VAEEVEQLAQAALKATDANATPADAQQHGAAGSSSGAAHSSTSTDLVAVDGNDSDDEQLNLGGTAAAGTGTSTAVIVRDPQGQVLALSATGPSKELQVGSGKQQEHEQMYRVGDLC